MPSETFLNLPKEKQNNLIESAILEFSEKDYNSASINKIIQRIGIPRGSFYMYFQDKEDLYSYILNFYFEKFEKKTISLLKEENGDFIKMCELLYNAIIDFCNNSINKKLLNHFFKEMRFSTERKLLFQTNKDKFDQKKALILSLIDHTLYTYQNLDELFDAFMFAMFTTISAVTHYFMNESDHHFEKAIYLKRLHIIKYGIYRKEEKNENNH